MKKQHNILQSQLNVTTVYDFLKSTIEIDAYLDFIIKNKQTAAAFVGNRQFFGIAKFFLECQKRNIQPIVGFKCEIKWHKINYKVVIYAKNSVGYSNLLQINFLNSKEDLIWENITQFLTDCQIVFLYQNPKNEAQMIELCQSENWDANSHFIGCEITPSANLITNCKSFLLPFYPVRYLEMTDKIKYQSLLAIKFQIKLDELKNDVNYHWKTSSELKNEYLNADFTKNLKHFYKDFNFKHENVNSIKIKTFPTGKIDRKTYLWNKCIKALNRQFKNQNAYWERFKYEFDIISKQNWIDYILIVADYIEFARKKNILVGPGRGSACGSLICFLLKITMIDPLKYQLIFERFLNPKLALKPDIDTDFEDGRRKEILAYLFQKYGYQHVAQISTFQTIGMRMAFRDVGRILNIDLKIIDQICKLINPRYNNDFDTTIEKNYLLKKFQSNYSQLFTIAKSIMNLPRQSSIHAAGIIFVQQPINTVFPCFIDNQNFTVTQFDMYDVKNYDLIKMDLLSLRNLTLLHEIHKKIQNVTQKNIIWAKIPLNDKKTFDDLSNGNTLGIFQLESPGMVDLITRLKPQSIEDIAATISLFRPGPMQNRDLYLQRRLGEVSFRYWIPEFENILKNTYGIPLYQEQIIYLVQQFANFNLSEADQLRQIISKKQSHLITTIKNKFWKQSETAKRAPELILRVWKLIEKFVGYGFNRSHAIAYSIIAYWMTYFKSNYSEFFYLALLNNNIGSKTKTEMIFFELRQKYQCKFQMSINKSTQKYVLNSKTKTILLPLNIINGVGTVYAQKILEEKTNNGQYKSLTDFIQRMFKYGFNKTVLKNLITANAFADFKYNRATLLHNLDNILLYAEVTINQTKKIEILKTIPNFQIEKKVDDWKVNLHSEWKSFGFLFDYRFLTNWSKNLQLPFEITQISLQSVKQLTNLNWNNNFCIGIITKIVTRTLKNDKTITFITVNDSSTVIELTCFENLWKTHQLNFKQFDLIAFQVQKTMYRNRTTFVVKTILAITSLE